MRIQSTSLLLSTCLALLSSTVSPALASDRCEVLFTSTDKSTVDPRLTTLSNAVRRHNDSSSAAMDIRRFLFAPDTSTQSLEFVSQIFLDQSISSEKRNLWTDILLSRSPATKSIEISKTLLARNEKDPIILRDVILFARALKQQEQFYRMGLALEYKALKRLQGLTSSQDPATADRARQVAQSWFGLDAIGKVRDEYTRGLRTAIDPSHHLRHERPSSLQPFKLVDMDLEYRFESDNQLFGVRYFHGRDQIKNRLYFEDGRLFDGQGKLLGLHGEPVRIDYVMDQNGYFFGGQAKHDDIHHSSYLAGAAVAGAGELVVREGQIEMINRKSGHYRPSQEIFQQVLSRLSELGVEVPAPTDQRSAN